MKVEKEIQEIKRRNRKVEADKAWEVSGTRKIIIAILTYFVLVVFFHAANLEDPWVNSAVAAAAFILSTLTLPIFKQWWVEKYYD